MVHSIIFSFRCRQVLSFVSSKRPFHFPSSMLNQHPDQKQRNQKASLLTSMLPRTRSSSCSMPAAAAASSLKRQHLGQTHLKSLQLVS